jgi:hypothetical protein
MSAVPNYLPVQSTSFIGRKREIVEVTGLLDGTRLLGLAGSTQSAFMPLAVKRKKSGSR